MEREVKRWGLKRGRLCDYEVFEPGEFPVGRLEISGSSCSPVERGGAATFEEEALLGEGCAAVAQHSHAVHFFEVLKQR